MEMIGLGHPSSAQTWIEWNTSAEINATKSKRVRVFGIKEAVRNADVERDVSASIVGEKSIQKHANLKGKASKEHGDLKDMKSYEECVGLKDIKTIQDYLTLKDIKRTQDHIDLKDIKTHQEHANLKDIKIIQRLANLNDGKRIYKHVNLKNCKTIYKHVKVKDAEQEKNILEHLNFKDLEREKTLENHINLVVSEQELYYHDHINLNNLERQNAIQVHVNMEDLHEENSSQEHVILKNLEHEKTIHDHLEMKDRDREMSIEKYINLSNVKEEKSIQKHANLNDSEPEIPIFLAEGFPYSLQDCRKKKDLTLAKKIHQQICGVGLDKVLEDQFVAIFVECGSIFDAQLVFNKLVFRNEYAWTHLLQGYIDNGKLQDAFKLLQNMQEDCIHPSRCTYLALLKACIQMRCLRRVRELHFDIIKEGHEKDSFVRSTLVDVYMKIGSPIEALSVFEEVQDKDVFVWTTLIGGYSEKGLNEEALNCFQQMQREGVTPDRVTYVWCLKSCINLGWIDMGQKIHYNIINDGLESDSFVGSTLVSMYARYGFLADARELLSELPTCNTVSWNALISGYLQHSLGEEALNCLKSMKTNNISPNEVTFVSCLKACASIGALHVGQEIHSQIIKQGFEKDTFLGSILMDMYMKCGSFKETCQVFDELTLRDVVSWTTLIAGYVEHGFCEEALSCLEKMQADGTSADALTFVCILNGCGNAKDIKSGFQVHVLAIKRGLEGSSSISNALIRMYAEVNLFAEARFVFDKLLVKDVLSWNSLIGGLNEYGLFEEALKCIDQMKLNGTCMNITTFIHGLQSCANMEDANRSFELHAEIIKNGFEKDSFIGNIIVDVYSKCGCLLEGQHVIDGLSDQSSVSWSSIIAGYAEHGHQKEVLDCLEHMQKKDNCQDVVTFICGLKACSSIGLVRKGLELYIEIVKDGLESDIFVGSSVVDMFGKWGALIEAQEVLDELPVRNVVSWTALITAYAEFASFEDVMRCCEQMQLEGVCPNAITYVSILKACSSQRVIDMGQKMHNEILKLGFQSNAFLCATLVDMYAACGFLMEAKQVFTTLSTQDILSWNALIGGYAEHGKDHEALACLKDMQLRDVNPDNVTYLQCVKACTNLGAMDFGQELYVEIIKKGFESDFLVCNSLVNMYIKHGAFLEAKMVSNHLPLRDTASWNPLIGGYLEKGFCQEAMTCFKEMQLEGVMPDTISWNTMLLGCAEQGENEMVILMYAQMQEQGMLADSATFVSIIEACGNMASLKLGEKICALCCRCGHLQESEVILATAIIDMYGKCGRMNSAQQLFEAMPIKDPTMWNALIIGYSRQGECEYALYTFERMKETTRPDAVTFLCVLTACNHGGLIDRAQEYFESMNEYGVPSSIKHHNCMLDLLARGGRLQDALKLLKQMSFEPNDSTFNTILGACRKWKDADIAQEVFEYALQLDQTHAGAFVLMSNMYADVHIWEESQKIEEMRKELAN